MLFLQSLYVPFLIQRIFHSLVILSAVHGFLNATYWVLEAERVNTMFRANVKGMTSFANVPLLGTIVGNSITAGTVCQIMSVYYM